jgi:hypothetical protein
MKKGEKKKWCEPPLVKHWLYEVKLPKRSIQGCLRWFNFVHMHLIASWIYVGYDILNSIKSDVFATE